MTSPGEVLFITRTAVLINALIFVLFTIGHYRELDTGKIEGLLTKIGMLLGVMFILAPITGIAIIFNIMMMYPALQEATTLLALVSFPISFVSLCILVLLGGETANIIYVKILNKTPHQRWQ